MIDYDYGPARMVEFPGHGRFWHLPMSRGRTDGPLAPLEHCDSAGNVICLEVSYAHVGTDGNIRRYHEVIGTLADLKEVQL